MPSISQIQYLTHCAVTKKEGERMNASDKVIKVMNDKDMETFFDKLDDEIIKLVRASCAHAGLNYKTEVKLMNFFIENIDDRFIEIIGDYMEKLQDEIRESLKEPEM